MNIFKIISCALLCVLLSCGQKETEGNGKLPVVGTTTMIADMVREIGGEEVDVLALMGPGVDPHLYKASATDVTKLQRAQIVFYNGLALEGKMGELFDQQRKIGKPVYALSAILKEENLIKGDGTHADPHIWGDAGLWAECVQVVVEGLSKKLPEKADMFLKRGNDLQKRYQALDAWVKKQVGQLNKEQKILITSHDAFNYFGRAYGFQVVGVQGISTVSEAGLADITKVADFIKEKNIPSIFVESSVSKAAIERISKDSGAQIGGELFSDALGIPGDVFEIEGQSFDKGTYEGMLRWNVHSVVQGLRK